MKKNYSDILEKNGYFIIKNFLNKNKKFNNFSKEINKIIFKKSQKRKIIKLWWKYYWQYKCLSR